MYRIAVCEDNPDNMQLVLDLLEECYGNELWVDTYEEASDLLGEWMREGKRLQDILLMDIKFKDEDGIFIVRELQKKFGQVYVIFMTGFPEYAEQAFEREPVSYLIKPLTGERLRLAVEKGIARIRKEEEMTVAIPVKGGIACLIPRDIIYVESNLRVLEIHGQNQSWTVKMKFAELMEKMPGQFVRVHQSFAVNLDYVTALRGHKMEMAGGTEIPVSRARYGEARKRFLSYLQDKVGERPG